MSSIETESLKAYWNGNRNDTLTDSELLDLAKEDINRLIDYVVFLEKEVERWKNAHHGVVQMKKRMGVKLGDLLRTKFVEKNSNTKEIYVDPHLS